MHNIREYFLRINEVFIVWDIVLLFACFLPLQDGVILK
ncbi:hypothetical protein BVRB_3g063440 [Beta vulgaris subsp. vulgaris]|nr:hypothetical protein BVRB_3g063440 [Beta vulgaris subsp. vulgaris]